MASSPIQIEMSAHYTNCPTLRNSNLDVDPPVSDIYDGQDENDYYNSDDGEPMPMTAVIMEPSETNERDNPDAR